MRCAARVREHTRLGFATGPYGRNCLRDAVSLACGIPLCDQHRGMVTHWEEGQEVLNPGAARRFAAWRVEPVGPFVPEDEQQLPLPR
jgi:hypothetical protein